MSMQEQLSLFVSVARDEIGVTETRENYVKYGDWYGMNGQPWCAMFVSWCAEQAGILTTETKSDYPYVPRMSYTPYIQEWYLRNRRLLEPNLALGNPNYPILGDIVLIDSSGGQAVNHVGIVADTNGTEWTVIEGNCGNMVKAVRYTDLVSASGAKILYLCSNHTHY